MNPAAENNQNGNLLCRDSSALAAVVGGGPETMILTRAEVNRALEIKAQAQRKESNLKPLSDYEYVQYALTTREETMDQVLYRMEMMQAFKEQYRIHDTPEEGVEIIQQLSLDYPGLFLSLAHLSSSNNFMSVLDWAQLLPQQCNTQNQTRTFMGFVYYVLQCKTCQFRAIREGSSVLVECMDVTTQNYDFQFFGRIIHEIVLWYPKLQKEVFLLNSPTVVNVAVAMWRRYMRPDEQRAVHLGHKMVGLEGERIDQFYRIPSLEAANLRLFRTVQILLEHRCKMEREFNLPGSPLSEGILFYDPYETVP